MMTEFNSLLTTVKDMSALLSQPLASIIEKAHLYEINKEKLSKQVNNSLRSRYHLLPNLRNFYYNLNDNLKKESFLFNSTSEKIKRNLLNGLTTSNIKIKDIEFFLTLDLYTLLKIVNFYNLSIDELFSLQNDTYTSKINKSFITIKCYDDVVKEVPNDQSLSYNTKFT